MTWAKNNTRQTRKRLLRPALESKIMWGGNKCDFCVMLMGHRSKSRFSSSAKVVLQAGFFFFQTDTYIFVLLPFCLGDSTLDFLFIGIESPTRTLQNDISNLFKTSKGTFFVESGHVMLCNIGISNFLIKFYDDLTDIWWFVVAPSCVEMKILELKSLDTKLINQNFCRNFDIPYRLTSHCQILARICDSVEKNNEGSQVSNSSSCKRETSSPFFVTGHQKVAQKLWLSRSERERDKEVSEMHTRNE